jgi:DNA polymerase-3 subunit delta'
MVKRTNYSGGLVHREQVDPNLAEKIAAGTGNYTLRYTYYDDNNEFPFEQWFVTWVRAALKPKEMQLQFKI